MKRFLVGLLVMGCLWAVQAQAAEVTWQKDIKPLFDKHCADCHGADAPEHDEFSKEQKKWTDKGLGMRMDSYSLLIAHVGWPHTGALMRRLDDGTVRADKKPGNMYVNLGSTEAERKANLATFKSWVGSWSVKRWSEISKEELTAIKAKY
jgi:hypothetical protein